MNILFVCSGNICRSPMAEYYFRCLIEEAQAQTRMNCSSAGIHADDGTPASFESFAVMKEVYGIDISRHLSRRLTHELAFASDLILVMTASQRQALILHMPELRSRIHLVLEYDPFPHGAELHDPHGYDIPVYANCLERMRPALENLLSELLPGTENIRSL